MLLNGFFHDSLMTNNEIFPSDIQNIMWQYTNLLFAKLRYNIEDKPDSEHKVDDEMDMHYLAFESDTTLGAIALSIEKNNDYDYEEKTDELSQETKQKKECNYPQFIHLWLRFKDINIIYDEPADMSAFRDRWLELPEDYENKTLNCLDQQIETEHSCVEIAVEKYNQNNSEWPFSHGYDQDTIEVCLETGDIIDAFFENHHQWYESVVKSVEGNRANVHYIGCDSAKDTLLTLGPNITAESESESFLI